MLREFGGTDPVSRDIVLELAGKPEETEKPDEVQRSEKTPLTTEQEKAKKRSHNQNRSQCRPPMRPRSRPR